MPPIAALILTFFSSLNLQEQSKTKFGCDILRLWKLFNFEVVYPYEKRLF